MHFHWTSIALYPLLYFAVLYYNQPAKRKLFRWLVLPFVVLFFVARILLMVPFVPNMHVGNNIEFNSSTQLYGHKCASTT